ncbi:hypothetical protein BD779DRAFT_1676571 [Infundibulicybe gibba]|nr:hypothetical protein BD779DRAFT_1676571 [Infundibulicybe gibba]
MTPNIRVTRTSTTRQTVTQHTINNTPTQAVSDAPGGGAQVVGANAPIGNPMNQELNRVVHGFLYPMNGPRARSKPCQLGGHAGNISPNIGVNKIFHRPPGARLHPDVFCAAVIIGRSKFIVYGHDNRANTRVVNESILAIRPTFSWYGEVFVLVIGKKGRFLPRPRTNKRDLNDIVSLFVSRTTEARDMGRPMPIQIVSPYRH